MYTMVCGSWSNYSVTAIRWYDEVNEDFEQDLKECTAVCRNIIVIDDTDVVYEFDRDKDKKITSKKSIHFEPIRKITKRDLAIVQKAWRDSFVNYDLDFTKA